MRMRWSTAVAVAIVVAATIATDAATATPSTRSSAAVGVAAAGGARPAITWTDCADVPTVKCGSIRVPLDWSRPHGATIKIAFARRRATGPGPSLGPLFVNPGGPGASGLQLALAADQALPPALLQRFDIVGVDPRGVGSSTPVRCAGDVFPPGYTLFPGDDAEYQGMLRQNRALGASCLRGTGALLGHLDTQSAARDHDAVRAALGADKLSWLGLSYGTELGETYARLFPKRVRAMVLDGNLDHSLTMVPWLADTITATEDGLVRFARWCDTSTECVLHGQPVLQIFDQVVARADRHPVAVPGASRPVTGEDVRLNVNNLLLLKQPAPLFGGGWPAAAQALAKARDGDLSDFATSAQTGPTDELYAQLAIECMDYDPQLRGFADLHDRMTMGRQLAPHLQGAGQGWTVNAQCAGWPVRPAFPPKPVRVRGTVRILVVNATHDPSTPYVWAQGVASEIDNHALLTRVGDGHTSTLTSPCVRDRITRYLLSATVPRVVPDCVE